MTAQSLFFLEELCRVKRSDTQTFSNCFKISSTVCQAHKNLQTPRNSYKIPTKHQVHIKFLRHGSNNIKHHKNKRKSISKLFHAHNGFKLVPTWFLPFLWFRLFLPTSQGFLNCSHAHALFQDRFKDVQVGSRWCSTLYILSPNFHTPSWTVVLYTEVAIG